MNMPKKAGSKQAGVKHASPRDAGKGAGSQSADGDARPSARAIIEHMITLNPVYELLAIELLEAERGRSRFAMPLDARIGNTFGIAQGGLIFAFADICFGFTANAAQNEKGVSSSAEIHWLSPGFIGDRLVAEAVEVWRKGRNGLYDVRLWNEAQGETVAIVHGRMRFIGGKVLDV